MAHKAQIGDILEIPTKGGLAYAQFSHYHESPPKMGAIIRVLPGTFAKRPDDLQSLADKKELYYTLFPVQAAVNKKIFSIIGHANLPLHARAFPLFRNGLRNQQTGKIDQWWLWDGEKSWKIGNLSDNQLDLSIEAGWNDSLLIQRIEQGWTPRNSEAFIQAARLKKAVEKNPTIKSICHILLFKEKDSAQKALRLIDDIGLKSSMIDHGAGFAVSVRQSEPLTDEYIENATLRLTGIAHETGGLYDAWETELA